MTFWSNATTEQRLAQIDGGIECQMSIRHIAINCGASHREVKAFGHSHGRAFTGKPGVANSQSARIARARQMGAPETAMKDAFSIFDNRPKPSDFLDSQERQL